jgi:hypothetical protein
MKIIEELEKLATLIKDAQICKEENGHVIITRGREIVTIKEGH